jgi:hypothetical protein
MSYQELKAKLAEMGLSTTGNTAALQARYDAAIAAGSNADANADASSNAANAANNSADAAVDAAAPEKVLCNGVELTPVSGNDATITTFVSKRRQREFPQLLTIVPDGEYHTTGRYALYVWENGEDTPPTFLVVEISDGTNNYFVGEWEFPARTFGIRLQDGSEFTPNWVLDTLATGSARSEAVRNMPANTPCRKRSGVGRWLSKSGERNYALSWIEQPE